MKRPVTLLMFALLHLPSLSAAEVERVDVAYEDGEYRVTVEAVLHARTDAVYAVLTDYPRWAEINDLIKESYLEEVTGPDLARVRTVSEGCVLFFCKSIEQTQWMRTAPDWRISAEVLPEISDLKSGWARTHLIAEGDATRFHYEMALVPDFWVPPIIGPMMIRAKLRKQAIETAVLVEARAATP